MPKATAIYLHHEAEATVEAFSIVGGKWTVVVVARLGHGKLRFSELRRELSGISQKTLTATLRALERDGFVVRTLFPTIPPRVEYELTGLGVELLDLSASWQQFTRRHRAHVEAARRRFDAAAAAAPAPRIVLGLWRS